MYKTTLSPSTTCCHQTFWQVIQSYVQLTKPRIIVLLLITTVAGMATAAKGHIDLWLLLITLVSAACALCF
jgi:protoheme IX farnesyltransferase